jgi:hypothetical protein
MGVATPGAAHAEHEVTLSACRPIVVLTITDEGRVGDEVLGLDVEVDVGEPISRSS